MVAPKLTEAYRLEKRLLKKLGEGVKEFQLIEPADRLLLGLSGGKDSLALLELLGRMKRNANNGFEVVALHVRMAGIDYRSDTAYLESMAEKHGVRLVVRTASFAPDRQPRRSPCFLCSWNRRKVLFETAQELNCNKIALGHHQDDILRTALMNLGFNGTFSTMPARLKMRKFPVTIVRPLCKVAEADLKAWAQLQNYRPLEKICPYDKASTRTSIASVWERYEALNPEFRYHLWHALAKEGKLVEEAAADF